MKNARGRDIGEPIIHKHYIPATPELVERTRRNLERALSKMWSEYNGYPTEITIEWGEKPEGYGQDT